MYTAIDDAAAWRSCEVSKEAISVDLRPTDVAELSLALRASRGIPITQIDSNSFPLGAHLSKRVQHVNYELQQGRGLVLLRGFPIDQEASDIERMYWGLCSHIGSAAPQSLLGDLIGQVTDVSGKDPNERAYRNSLALPFHTDSADIVTMLSLQKAQSGGLSIFSSALAVHNEILRARPDLLEPLFRGYKYHQFGEHAKGGAAVTEGLVPVLSTQDGQVSARIVPEYIDMAEAELGQPLSKLDRAALNFFLETAEREDMRLELMLDAGDLLLFNNRTLLHSRTAFYDHDDPARKRHLIRLWLLHERQSPFRRPLSPQLVNYENSTRNVRSSSGSGDSEGGLQGHTECNATSSAASSAASSATYFSGSAAREANRGRYGEEEKEKGGEVH
jgi:hypothetical protein